MVKWYQRQYVISLVLVKRYCCSNFNHAQQNPSLPFHELEGEGRAGAVVSLHKKIICSSADFLNYWISPISVMYFDTTSMIAKIWVLKKQQEQLPRVPTHTLWPLRKILQNLHPLPQNSQFKFQIFQLQTNGRRFSADAAYQGESKDGNREALLHKIRDQTGPNCLLLWRDQADFYHPKYKWNVNELDVINVG